VLVHVAPGGNAVPEFSAAVEIPRKTPSYKLVSYLTRERTTEIVANARATPLHQTLAACLVLRPFRIVLNHLLIQTARGHFNLL
jgi:hypothetical protein